jgi:hypothetical protein
MKHLDAETLRSYRAKRLPPTGLLAADEHLASCGQCRGSLIGGEDGSAADSIIDALTTDEMGGEAGDEEEHLSYDILEAWTDGKLSPREHRAASAHLQSCPRCMGDLADLREVATSIPRVAAARRGPSLRVAAVILLAVIGLASWLAMRHARTESVSAPVVAAPLLTIHDGTSIINVDHDGSIHGMALSAADAAAVRAALLNGRIDVAPQVAGLQRERGTLMGTPQGTAFDVVMPAATFIRSTRPQFAWTSAGPEATYRVEVYDEARTLAVESPLLHDLAWTADRDLPRGHAYVWQVVAMRDAERIVAPQPPAPEAHFGVIDDTAAARLDAAARSGSHLLLALAAAHEGVMDDARHELDTLARLNPGSSQVQRLAHSLTPATR